MSDCILWRGALDKDGYGHHRLGRPHRIAYEQAHGPIPAGLEIDHLCRNRACINPEHLEAVTHAENLRRGLRVSGLRCKNGHLREPSNIYYRPNGRHECRACTRERQRRYVA